MGKFQTRLSINTHCQFNQGEIFFRSTQTSKHKDKQMSESQGSGKSTKNPDRLESLHHECVDAENSLNQAIYESEKASDRQKSK